MTEESSDLVINLKVGEARSGEGKGGGFYGPLNHFTMVKSHRLPLRRDD